MIQPATNFGSLLFLNKENHFIVSLLAYTLLPCLGHQNVLLIKNSEVYVYLFPMMSKTEKN